jgi:hypothetical protein
MRRRKLLVALAGLAVVVAVGAVALWPQSVPKPTPVPSHSENPLSTERTRSPGILWDSAKPIIGDYRTKPDR